MRTADSRTFEQADGTFVTELFSGPIFYQPDGSADWQPIDTRLEPVTEPGSDTDARADKAPTVLSLAEADSVDGFVTLAGGGHTISFRLPAGTAPGTPGTKPVIDPSGRFADYADFLPGGIGLRVFPRADGVKSFIVLPEKPAQTSFSFEVYAPGLTLDAEEDGTLAFRDAAGNVVGRIPRPFMVDSSDVEGLGSGIYSEAVTVSLEKAGETSVITLTVDPEFLETAVYPVYIDPTTTTFPTGTTTAGDTFANSQTPNTNYTTYQRPDSPFYYEQWHGNTPGSSYYNEVYLRFNSILETLGAAHIDSASLQFYPYWQYWHYEWRPTWAERVTSDWSAASLTWNNRPSTTDDLSPGTFDTKEGVWADFELTAHVQDVVNGSVPNYGVMLHANGTGQGNWKRIVSRNDPGSLKPKLVVQWSPFTVSAAYPVGGPTATRTLSWSNDLDGPITWYEAQVSTQAANFNPVLVSSGQVQASATSWTIPGTTTLTAGATYLWRVRAKFGGNASWTAWSNGSFVHEPGTNLGLPAHNTFESLGLGNGDSLSVNVSTANAVLSHPLVDLPIRSGSLSLGLTYNSQSTTNSGTGPGWRLSAMRRLSGTTGSVVLTAGDGSQHTFTVASVNGTVTTYNRPATIYATLRKDTAQALEWTLTYRDQSVDSFDVLGTEGLLAKSADRFGNAVDFTYYASSNRLYRATDPAGRYIEFTWDTGASPARLASFTDWAYISSGIIQPTQTGSRRQYRFFYEAGGQLIGWSNPANTSGSCPTMASNLTCLEYASGLLTRVKKRQTFTTLSGGALGTTNRDITTELLYTGTEVREVRDAEQFAAGAAGTTFTRNAPAQMRVVRPGTPATTTTYGHVSATDSLGRVQSVWRKLGTTQIEQRTNWDSAQPIEPASVTDNYGAQLGTPARTVSYTYATGSMGLVSRTTEPLDGTNNRTTDYTYNANNDLTEVIVALNGSSTTRTITRYCYTTSGCSTSGAELTVRLTIANYKDGGKGGTGGNVDDVTTEFLYDGYGRQIRQTRYNYDAAGTLLDFTRIGYTYDAEGNVGSQIDHYSDGLVQDYWYDRNPHNTTGVRTDLTTTHTYDTAGDRISSADPRRAIAIANSQSLNADDYVTRTTFDPLNQPIKQQVARDPADSSAPKFSTSDYDELGVMRQTTDFGGLVSASEYDRAGRAMRTFEDPDGTGGSAGFVTGETTYDAAGRVRTTKDRRQLADSSLGYTEFFYDDLGRKTQTIEAQTASGADIELPTSTGYDAVDRQVTLTVGNVPGSGQTTNYRYDLGGRVTEQDDEFTCTRTTYDYRDLAITVSEGLAPGNPCTGSVLRTVTNTHDGLARLTRSEVTAGQGDDDVLVDDTFDGAGNRLSSASYVDATGTTTSATYTVNALDETITEVRSDGSVTRTIYDAVGNAANHCYWATTPDDDCLPVGSSFTNPPTRHTTTTYDARNQRITLLDAATNATTTYDPDHNYQVKAIYIPTAGGKEHQSLYAYDGRHRLATITHQLCTISSGHSCSATTATGSDAYAYDTNDNRAQVNESNGATSVDRRYCYDAHNRLQYRNTAAACSSSAKDESYVYDAAGNRMQSSVGGVTTDFAYDAEGQLCKVGATMCGTPNVTYDDAGRMRNWNGWWFSYDGEGRLTTACSASGCTTSSNRILFTYDGEGRRTQIKTTPANGTAIDLDFRYQGSSIVEELTDDVVTRQYLVDETGAIVKLIIPTGQANAATYLVTWNGHGDALALHRIDPVNGTLTLANSYTYSSWGAPTTTTHNSIPDLDFRFLYVGRYDVQWDNAFGLGLTYMHARHYAPALGRFLQPDPAEAEQIPFGYASNNPLTELDPLGTCSRCAMIRLALIRTGSYYWLATRGRAVVTVGTRKYIAFVVPRSSWLYRHVARYGGIYKGCSLLEAFLLNGARDAAFAVLVVALTGLTFSALVPLLWIQFPFWLSYAVAAYRLWQLASQAAERCSRWPYY